MNTVRVERRPTRAGPAVPARFGKRSLLAVLAVCLLFAGGFALARTTGARRAAAAETSANLSVASVHAAMPLQLAQAAPIELSIEPPPKPKPSPPAPAVIAPRAPLSAPAPTVQAPPPPAPAPPAPAPERSAPESPAPPSKPAPSSSGSSHPSSSGGGTFESSG